MGKKLVEISATELKKLKNKVEAQARKKEKKALRRYDGLSPHIKQQCRQAVRTIWLRSEPRKLAVKRVLRADGMSLCEECLKYFAKTTIDHIVAVAELDAGFIERMFVPSSGLKSLCHECHKVKSASDRKKLAEKKAS